MRFKKHLLQTAVNQTIGSLLLTDEDTGARKLAAVAKAIIELEENDTFRFDRVNKVLRFTSRHSGKRRIVTAYGCATVCECQGKYSYHRAAYDIVSRYFELDDNPTEQPLIRQRFNQGKPEKIGNYSI